MDETTVDQSTEEVIATEPQATEQVEADEVPADQPEADAVDDSEEIDYEGEKYKVPKVLKEAFMRQSDYTRKTQEVAESRKTLEQQQTHFQQTYQRQQQHIQDYAQLHALDMQMHQFKDINWQELIDKDPVEAMKLDRQVRTLADMRQGIANRIQQVEASEAFSQQQRIAKLVEQGHETLKRDIPNWSDETRNQIKDYATTLGYTPQEVAQVVDPRAVKMMHKAMLYDQMMKKAATTPKAEVKPITKVTAKRDGQQKDPDKMTTDEWMKWRNQQIRAAR